MATGMVTAMATATRKGARKSEDMGRLLVFVMNERLYYGYLIQNINP